MRFFFCLTLIAHFWIFTLNRFILQATAEATLRRKFPKIAPASPPPPLKKKLKNLNYLETPKIACPWVCI